MTEFSKIKLEQKLEEAKKEIEHYKKIARQVGNLYLRETEALSKLLRWRKQAEEELRESEGKLNAMLQSIGDYMSMMDKNLNIIWANKITKAVFGNDITGKKCYYEIEQNN